MSSTIPFSAKYQLRSLFEGLAGTKVVVPSLETICPSWPLSKHPDVELIRNDFTEWVNL